MDPTNFDHQVDALKHACINGDAEQAITALEQLPLEGQYDFAPRLRSLELQLRLQDFFSAEQQRLQSLLAERPTAADKAADTTDESLNEYGEHITDFLENGEELIETLFNTADTPGGVAETVRAGLQDAKRSKAVQQLILDTAPRDVEWLALRSSMVQTGVAENLWDVVEALSDATAAETATLDATIVEGFRRAAEEAQMAVDGLLMTGESDISE